MKKILAILLLVPAMAWAQWTPNKPITVIVSSAPGAFIEVSFRMLAKVIEAQNPGVTFVIENRPGADGVIATNALLKAAPDGYTIGSVSEMSTFVTQDVFQRNIKQYQYNSFVTPFLLNRSPQAVVANIDSPVNTPKEFVNKLRISDKPVNVAIGGGPHKLAYEYIMDRAGNNPNVKSVAYQGPLQAVTAVAQQDKAIEFGIMPLTVAWPLIQSKKVKLIAVTSGERIEQLPQVPVIKDAVPGLEIYAAAALLLPPGTPKEITDWYVKVFNQAVRTKEARDVYRDNFLTFNPDATNPDGMKRLIEKTRQLWAPYINGPARDYN